MLKKISKSISRDDCGARKWTRILSTLTARTNLSVRDPRFPATPFAVTNQWIAPYSPYLSRCDRAHINVKFCGSVKAIKYIHKYVYEGADQTTVVLNLKADKVARRLSGRYIGLTDGVWQLFEFPMHEKFPPVQGLAVHLPGGRAVYFNLNLTLDSIREKTESACSTLMAFPYTIASIVMVVNYCIKISLPSTFTTQRNECSTLAKTRVRR